MVNKNEIKKSIIVSTAVLCAGTMLAVSPAQTVSAAVASPTGIAAVVEQAPSASIEVPVQWSTAEVYKNARYGETWGGTTNYGSYVRWEWLNDMSYVFEVENANTKDGTVLSYQYLRPIDMTGGGADDSYISHTDDNEPIRKWLRISKDVYANGDHLWNHLADYLQLVQSWDYIIEAGNTYLHTEEDDNLCRYTFNVSQHNTAYDTIQKGYCTIIEVKATGEEYTFWYEEQDAFFNSERALTVIYSCLPLVQ